ncbi:MAG: hypothetical protein U9O94_08855 [Nanoarchaeota archaeon]|nr:hypothetical protein [Nanoarchaeota archaeon]
MKDSKYKNFKQYILIINILLVLLISSSLAFASFLNYPSEETFKGFGNYEVSHDCHGHTISSGDFSSTAESGSHNHKITINGHTYTTTTSGAHSHSVFIQDTLAVYGKPLSSNICNWGAGGDNEATLDDNRPAVTDGYTKGNNPCIRLHEVLDEGRHTHTVTVEGQVYELEEAGSRHLTFDTSSTGGNDLPENAYHPINQDGNPVYLEGLEQACHTHKLITDKAKTSLPDCNSECKDIDGCYCRPNCEKDEVEFKETCGAVGSQCSSCILPPAEGTICLCPYECYLRGNRISGKQNCGGEGDLEIEFDYEYDTKDQLIKITDDLGRESRNVYDSRGKPIESYHPDSGTVRSEYTKGGSLIKTIDAKGNIIQTTYDKLNRVKTIKSFKPDGSPGEIDVVNIYGDNSGVNACTGNNNFGRVCLVKDKSGETRFEYDDRGRVINSIKTVEDNNFPVSYRYDNSDNVIEILDPYDDARVYSYDILGRLVHVDLKTESDETKEVVGEITYNPAGTIDSMTLGNDIKTEYTYTPREFLNTLSTTKQSGEAIFQRYYSYDSVGNIKSLRRGINYESNILASFDYDPLDRLIRVLDNNYYNMDIEYTYDSVGNRLTKRSTLPGGQVNEVSYNYPTTNNRLQSDDKYNYDYDANGNVIRKTSKYDSSNYTEYIYDEADRMIKTIMHDKEQINGKYPYIEYVYDYDNTRVKKKVYGKVEKHTTYVYDAAGNLINELIEYKAINVAPQLKSLTIVPGILSDTLPQGFEVNAGFDYDDSIESVTASLIDSSGATKATYPLEKRSEYTNGMRNNVWSYTSTSPQSIGYGTFNLKLNYRFIDGTEQVFNTMPWSSQEVYGNWQINLANSNNVIVDGTPIDFYQDGIINGFDVDFLEEIINRKEFVGEQGYNTLVNSYLQLINQLSG